MNPFLYPKSRHIRSGHPGSYRDASRYKPALRIEFERKCVYCQAPDTVRGYDAFGVDHYRPKKRFPAQATAYDNLFYACNACNARKGAYWPAAEHESTRFIPNPCDHEMFRHLRYAHARVEARTEAGRVALDLLDLNDSDAVAWREMILTALALALQKEQETTRVLEALRQKSETEPSDELESAIARLQGELRALEEHRTRLAGA